MVVRLLCALLLATSAALAPVAGCSVNPATGQTQFNLLSRAQEEAIGAEAAPQFTQEFGGPVGDPQVEQYVNNIGRRLAAETESYYPELNWEFTILNSSAINAFALPGGKVFITRGLAERLTNEAQLAAILGHEIGHVTARHANNRISQALGLNVGLAALGIAAGMSDEGTAFRQVGEVAIPALAIGGNLVLLSWGRDEESQADDLGMRYITRLGYDPRAQLQVMEILRDADERTKAPVEFLSTHPMPETRIRRIEQLLSGEYAHTQGNPAYGFFADRYEREFLSRLRQLPPPPPPQQQS